MDVGGIYVRVVCVHVCTYRMYVRTPVCVVYGMCKKNITTRSIRTCSHMRPCVHPLHNQSNIYACTENYKRFKVSIARTFTALLRLLVDVCQLHDAGTVLLWPVHERVVVCRKICTQQTVTARSCPFTWLLAHLLPLMTSHRLTLCAKVKYFKDNSQQQRWTTDLDVAPERHTFQSSLK